jgi:hypothetical protein
MLYHTIKVCELLKGLHGGNYHFIIEENKLVHISRYAMFSERKNNVICYDVDLSRIKDKTVLEFKSLKSGFFDEVWIYPAEDLAIDLNIRRIQKLPITILNNYEIVHLSKKERALLDEWNRYFKTMLNYIRKEVIEKGGQIRSTYLVDTHIKDYLKYPVSFLIPYSENARSMSLNGLTKQIHQIWIIIRILKEFMPIKDIYFKQAPYGPIASIGSYSLWYEFDLNPHTMCNGILWHVLRNTSNIPTQLERIFNKALELKDKGLATHLALRPDIVFTHAKNCDEFIQNPTIKLIIECKNNDYRFWKKDINNQIKLYAEIFEPEYMAVASLKPVPSYIKKELERYGILIIDNVYPGGLGEQELITYVKSALR